MLTLLKVNLPFFAEGASMIVMCRCAIMAPLVAVLHMQILLQIGQHWYLPQMPLLKYKAVNGKRRVKATDFFTGLFTQH
jgi:hypothetical protein